MTDTLAATTTPVPAGRGRWRLQLTSRQFTWGTRWQDYVIADMTDARSRRIETVKNGGATLTFTLDGHSPSAALITELTQDVIAFRWDEAAGADVPVFRGVIAQSQDSLSADRHTVTITCHDYLAVLSRRILTATYTATQKDQDLIVSDLVYLSTTTAQSSNGTSFVPGSYLPLFVYPCGPDGVTSRLGIYSGQLRDRTYAANSVVGEMISNLAAVIGGFDYDVQPLTNVTQNGIPSTVDRLRVFYPRQGVTRSDVVLAYGSTGLGGVAGLSRSINSADYSNHIRVVGNNGASDPAAPQLFSEVWNSDANNVTTVPVGLWSSPENDSDVSVQSTLDQNAAAELKTAGVLVPSYSLTLAPHAYRWGTPNIGDTVPLVIQSGRLNVMTNVDVVGITYDIGDDGQEDVELAVGRPAVTFGDLFSDLDRTVNALARR